MYLVMQPPVGDRPDTVSESMALNLVNVLARTAFRRERERERYRKKERERERGGRKKVKPPAPQQDKEHMELQRKFAGEKSKERCGYAEKPGELHGD